MNTKLKEKIFDLVDALETEYGDLEGFEVRLEHFIEDGTRSTAAEVKEFSISYLHKEVVPIK